VAAPLQKEQLQEEEVNAKSFTDIPGPKGLPIIGNLLELPKMIKDKNQHELLLENFQKYGPIWRQKMGNMVIVNTCDLVAVEKLHRLEGKYPRRIILEPWKHWRKENNHSPGVLIEDGPEWKRMRTLLDKQMLRPKSVATYDQNFNIVTEDFIAYIRNNRDKTNLNNTVPHMDRKLFNWSLETIGVVLYETRFGNFEEKIDPEISEFIEAVHQLFLTTSKVVFLPVKINRIVIPKIQKAHENAWESIFRVGAKMIDKRLEEMNQQLLNNEEVSGFLSSLLASQKMSLKEIYANISELMAAAVDTTSNTMQWVLYELARRPEIQKRLYDEVSSVIPSGERCTYQHLQHLPYLKAIIKEVLRMYPVAGASTRVLNDDLVLAGYRVPKDTLVISSTLALGRSAEFYTDPHEFRPERWLRGDGAQKHSFAWLPFGFGPRMCLGRRVAELEMHILLARISQNFELKPVANHELKMVTNGLLLPDKSVNVQMIDRQQ